MVRLLDVVLRPNGRPTTVLLDPDNERFRGRAAAERHVGLDPDAVIAAQPDAIGALRSDEAKLQELTSSMRTNGFRDIDRILTVRLTRRTPAGRAVHHHVVVEGNRRWLAITSCLRSHAAGEAVLRPEVLDTLQRIPAKAYVADDPAEALAAAQADIGLVHVVGKVPWGAYASGARFLAMYRRGLGVAEIATRLGADATEVARRLRAVALLEQLAETSYFRARPEPPAPLYSHAHEALEKRRTQQWLEFDDFDGVDDGPPPTFRARNPEALDLLARLFRLREHRHDDGSADVRRPLPVANRDVRRLPFVLAPERRATLLSLLDPDVNASAVLEQLDRESRTTEVLTEGQKLQRLLKRVATQLDEADRLARKPNTVDDQAMRLYAEVLANTRRLEISLDAARGRATRAA